MRSVAFEMRRIAGFWGWQGRQEEVEVYFGGKGPALKREATLRRILPQGIEPAWLRQVHSAKVLDASPGNNGEGDALVAERAGLALAVVTADCVPVLLASEGAIAAVHAGWRGLAQSILPAACERLAKAPSRGSLSEAKATAWIGPAIGPCCYEVGDDVARQVSAASDATVVRDGPRGRPHLDLAAAARAQLERCGWVDVRTIEVCTRCDAERLWSYRREGPGAGRNYAAIWRQPD